jgi:restriction endonuclease S subunit
LSTTTAQIATSTSEPELLPKGWRRAKLAELVADARAGFAAGQRDPAGTIQLRMNNVTSSGTWDWGSFIRVPVNEETIKSYVLQSGDVLFNNTNSTEMVGKTALFQGFPEQVVFSNHFTRIRTIQALLDPGFLALWLLSRWQAGHFARLCDKWIGQSAVQRSKLLALEIPTPPLSEQRRIAASLREQLAEAAKASGAVQAQIDSAHSLHPALSCTLFTNTAGPPWPKKRVEELSIRKLRTGLSKTGGSSSQYRCLSLSAVRNGALDLLATKPADVTPEEAQANSVRPGAFYVVRGNGNKSLVARGALAPSRIPSLTLFPDLLIEIIPNLELILPEYLRWVWDSHGVRAAIEARAMTSAGIYKINLTNLSTIEIPLPSLADQKAITQRCEANNQQINNLLQTLKGRLQTLVDLQCALLREAFYGNI